MQDQADIERRLARLAETGVVVVDRRQTWIAPEVDLARIHAGAVLHPGTRLYGAGCFVGRGAEVGTEGPATLRDSVLDERARIASGYAEGAVLLREASVGAAAHVRPGTLLEEGARTAHGVGLKHTILLSFVTLGSLINFCDCLMAGGTGATDHSEVGSGFIHFNFTPLGDKATPSLVGDVVNGVFLREPRIFLGGSGGMVGPRKIGYGSTSGAGQVLRSDVAAGRVILGPAPQRADLPRPPTARAVRSKLEQNVEYVANLVALLVWYRDVRLPRLAPAAAQRLPVQAAIDTIDVALAERLLRLNEFLQRHGLPVVPADRAHLVAHMPPCPLDTRSDRTDHVSWVRGLTDGDVDRGRAWLAAIVTEVRARLAAPAAA